MIGADNDIKVLVADDSNVMRLLISDVLNEFSGIQVVATANNGKEAVQKTLEDEPDVIVMDINMGQYSGLYGVDHIMSKRPTPIIILSAVGNSNLAPVMEALSKGAFDYLNKPAKHNTKIRDIGQALADKIHAASYVEVTTLLDRKIHSVTHAHSFLPTIPYDVIVIGSSTGGPSAVEKVLARFPVNLPIPVLVAQHMPENFIPSFAERLNSCTPLHVQVSKPREVLEKGNVYIAPGTRNTIIKRNELGEIMFSNTVKKFKEFNGPSINALMISAADVYGERVLGVILTGMGSDGVEGLKTIKDQGGYTVVQDRESSVVYGMPGKAVESGVVDRVVPINDMGMFLMSCLS